MGFGGAVVRDVLLGNLPPAAFTDPLYFATAAGATLLVRLSGKLWHITVPQPRLHAYEMRLRRREARRTLRRARHSHTSTPTGASLTPPEE